MRKHIGSRLDDLLAGDGTLEQTAAVALKRVLPWQIAQAMKAHHCFVYDSKERNHNGNIAAPKNEPVDQRKSRGWPL